MKPLYVLAGLGAGLATLWGVRQILQPENTGVVTVEDIPSFNLGSSSLLGGSGGLSGVRGLRNNNPLNIRWDGRTEWQGMTGSDSGGFVIFSEPVYGIRAAARILLSYARRGIVTVSDIVSTWAPPIENDTDAYIQNVCTWTGFSPLQGIERDQYAQLLAAMIRMENGKNPYTLSEIQRGVSLA